MDECNDFLGEVPLFSTTNADCGYWQVEVDETEREKTAFTSRHKLHRCIRISFGFKNAPRTFQRAIVVILTPGKWKFSLVYLDDILDFSRLLHDQIKHVKQVLFLLRDGRATFMLQK